MKQKSKKIIIIVVSIILALAILGGVLVYMYMTTDFLKSDTELFMKYISQNGNILGELADSTTQKTYEDLKNQNAYESTTNINLEYSEGGNVANPLNNLGITLKTQEDKSNIYTYSDAKLTYENEEVLEFEYIQSDQLVGIKLTDAVKQFLTIRDDSNLSTVAKVLGVEEKQLKSIIEKIQEDTEIQQFTFSDEEKNVLKEKYMDILKQGIVNAKYEHQKKAVITVNKNTITTNSYTMNITVGQIATTLYNLLDTLKNEEVILNKIDVVADITGQTSIKELWINTLEEIMQELKEDANNTQIVKITVYQSNDTTVRTMIEVDSSKVIIDNEKNANNIKMTIQAMPTNDENIITTISKTSNENAEQYLISIDNIISNNENNDTNITISVNMNKIDDNIKLDTEIRYSENMNEVALIINNETNIVNKIADMVELNSSTNVTLNDLQEKTMSDIIKIVSEAFTKKFTEKMQQLGEKIGFSIINSNNNNNQIPQEETMTQEEINRFNSKFEFYTGESVSYENVKMLLEVVRTNLKATEKIGETTTKLYIEKNIENSELVDNVLSTLDEKGRYTVIIKYDEKANLISYITITKVKE